MKPTHHLEDLITQWFSLLPVLPGSVNSRYRVCGKPNCRCQDKDNPRKHRAYQLNYCLAGKNGTLYLKKTQVDQAEEMTRQYKNCRMLFTAIATEMVRLSHAYGIAEAYAMMDAVVSTVRDKLAGKTPPPVTVREITTSRDIWKKRAVERQHHLDKNRVTLRDLKASRTAWRTKALALKNEHKTQSRLLREQSERIKNLESSQPAASKKN